MRLSVQIEFDKVLDLETSKPMVVIGRSSNNDLVIPHDSISRKHCQIEINPKGGFVITDLGSSNGCYIDGRKLTPNVKNLLRPTQQLTIGKVECEISEEKPVKEKVTKIVSTKKSNSGDFTATIRISRLDLNRPVMTPEIEKLKTVPGPRNPVTDMSTRIEVKQANKAKFFFLMVLISALICAAWYLAPN